MAVGAESSLLQLAVNRWRSRGGHLNVGGPDIRRVHPVGGRLREFGSRTYTMGILNLTPDSFSDGGRYNQVSVALFFVYVVNNL